MKLLLITNKVKTYALGFKTVLDLLTELGHEVVWAADFSNFIGDKDVIPCVIEQIDINTNPLNKTNKKAFRQICEIIRKHEIEAIQCSTPIGGLLGRMAGKKMKVPLIIYAAHGFLFFRGAPLINRTLYRWEEVFLAHYTDVLITITTEDYEAAQKFRLRSGKKPYLIHGAGVNVGVKTDVDKNEKRKSVGVPENAFVIISAGELNKNKNTEALVRAIAELEDKNVHYIACGEGPEKEKLLKLSEQLGVSSQIHLLGYRTDVAELMSASDVFVIMSFREGVPRALLEAMDLGLACVGSDTRGIRDLIDADKGGYICSPKKPHEFADALRNLQKDTELREKMGRYNTEKVGNYSVDVVKKELREIYVSLTV